MAAMKKFFLNEDFECLVPLSLRQNGFLDLNSIKNTTSFKRKMDHESLVLRQSKVQFSMDNMLICAC